MSVDYEIIVTCSKSRLWNDVAHVEEISKRLVAMEFGGYSEPLIQTTASTPIFHCSYSKNLIVADFLKAFKGYDHWSDWLTVQN